MGKKKTEDQDQIPLSETQNTAITGRQDVTDTDAGDIEITLNGKRVSSKVKDMLLGKGKNKTNDEEKEEDPFWAERPYRITEALTKDGVCNYAYEITRGTGLGDTHKVKGSAYFEDDLPTAFSKLNAHLAFIDDAFKFSGIEVTDIDSMHNHELTMLYTITGFSIKGDRDSETIIITGNKYLSIGGRMEIDTPKIALDNFSSYKWVNELRAAADAARKEVALYKEGKCHMPETEEEEKPDPRQSKIPFGEGDARDRAKSDELESDFSEAAL